MLVKIIYYKVMRHNKKEFFDNGFRRIVTICGCISILISVPVADAKVLKNKTYKENFTLKNGKVLEGGGINKTVIKGDIRVRDSGILRNLTVRDGSITLNSGASLTIENVLIKDAPGTAIETRGKGTLIVRNSSIIDSEGKAFYIQRGKHIIITGTTVRGSGEEAIDIRSHVSGVISGNIVTDNGESGIEVILGGSSLKISQNVLNNNGSSGIAAQYYTSSDKLGITSIVGNTMIGNKNYGLTCKTPSGGHPGDTYWRDSLRLEDNTISGNGAGSIAPRCAVRNVDSAAVKRALERARIKAEEEAARKAEEERRRREIAEQQRILEESENEFAHRIQEVRSLYHDSSQQSPVHVFFIGPNQDILLQLSSQRDDIMQISETVQTLSRQNLEENERVRVDNLSARIESVIAPLDAYIAQQKKHGLWRKIRELFA